MAILVGLLLVVFCIGVVLYPFLKAHTSPVSWHQSRSILQIQERRRGIYDDLEALGLEHSLGNLDDEEYEERSREYRLAAAATFRDQEMLEAADVEADEAINRELLRWRETRLNGVSDTVCPKCGLRVGEGTGVQCPHCDQDLENS